MSNDWTLKTPLRKKILKKKDKNFRSEFPGWYFEPVASYGFFFWSPSVESQVPACWIDELPSHGRVGLNHAVKGVLQGSVQCVRAFDVGRRVRYRNKLGFWPKFSEMVQTHNSFFIHIFSQENDKSLDSAVHRSSFVKSFLCRCQSFIVTTIFSKENNFSRNFKKFWQVIKGSKGMDNYSGIPT